MITFSQRNRTRALLAIGLSGAIAIWAVDAHMGALNPTTTQTKLTFSQMIDDCHSTVQTVISHENERDVKMYKCGDALPVLAAD